MFSGQYHTGSSPQNGEYIPSQNVFKSFLREILADAAGQTESFASESFAEAFQEAAIGFAKAAIAETTSLQKSRSADEHKELVFFKDFHGDFKPGTCLVACDDENHRIKLSSSAGTALSKVHSVKLQ